MIYSLEIKFYFSNFVIFIYWYCLVLWFVEIYGLIFDSLNLYDVEIREVIIIDFKDKGNSVLFELKISFVWIIIVISYYFRYIVFIDSMESNKDKLF